MAWQYAPAIFRGYAGCCSCIGTYLRIIAKTRRRILFRFAGSEIRLRGLSMEEQVRCVKRGKKGRTVLTDLIPVIRIHAYGTDVKMVYTAKHLAVLSYNRLRDRHKD